VKLNYQNRCEVCSCIRIG